MKKRQRALDEVLMRNEIRVENHNEVWRIGILDTLQERVVDVSGLCVPVIRTRPVIDPQCLACFGEPRPAPVVQDKHPKARMRQRLCANDGPIKDRQILVVGRDVDVDSRRRCRRPPFAFTSASGERSRVRVSIRQDSD